MIESERLESGDEPGREINPKSRGPSKLRPITRSGRDSVTSLDSTRSVFQDFLATHLNPLKNESSEQPLLGRDLEKSSAVPKERRPKLSRQKGRTNGAFEDEASASQLGSRPASSKSAVSTFQATGQELTNVNKEETHNVGKTEEPQEMQELKAPKKPKRKRNKLKDTEVNCTPEGQETEIQQDETVEADKTSNEEILGIIVHGTNRLSSCCSVPLVHPVVKVHILETSTGQYFQKSDRERPVTSYYECNSVDHILPVMTQPYIINSNNVSPLWEELLIFNENFSSLIQADPSSLVIFEIMDFWSPSSTAFHIRSEDKGWYPLAWAFLKPRGGNGHLNSGHKVCLQLYQAPPPSTFFFSSRKKSVHVYEWWRGTRRKLPGCLFVTFKPILPPQSVQPAMRSMIPLQQEGSILEENSADSANMSSRKSSVKMHISPQKSVSGVLRSWSRLPGQTCRVPLQQTMCLSTAEKGNFRVQFSPDGCFLACAACTTTGSSINIYEIPLGSQMAELKGHIGLIYDLDWNQNGLELVSASADGTARIWSPTTSVSCTCVIPHPSYVYAAKFHPAPDSKLIVTAGCDKLIRLWKLPVVGFSKTKLQLLQELEGHSASVNALCWRHEDNPRLYSGDSIGVIRCWMKTHSSSRDDYECQDEIKEKSLQGQAINSLNVLPHSKKIIVETRDGCVRSVHLYKHVVTHTYDGRVSSSRQYFRHGCLSPCGNLLFTLAEGNVDSDVQVIVWNTLNGSQVHKYTELCLEGSSVSSIHYHPLEHMTAFSIYGKNGSVYLYGVANRGPLKPLPSAIATARGSPLNEVPKETNSLQDITEENQLRMLRVLKKLDSVLTLSAKC